MEGAPIGCDSTVNSFFRGTYVADMDVDYWTEYGPSDGEVSETIEIPQIMPKLPRVPSSIMFFFFGLEKERLTFHIILYSNRALPF